LSWKAFETIGAQAIFLVRLLVLARLLVPEDFGLMAIGMTAIGVFRAVTEFGLLPALVQRSSLDKEHYDAAWSAGLLRGFAVCALTALAAPLIASLFGEPRAIPIIQALSIVLLVEMVASIKLADLLRDMEFRPLAIVGLAQALANTLAAVAAAPSLGVWALVLGTLCGGLTRTALSYVVAPYRPSFRLSRHHFSQLIHFGRWIMINSWIVVIGGGLLRVIITRKLGVAELGLFFLASRLALLPAVVASQVVGQVAFPLFARIRASNKETRAAFQGLFSATIIIFVPACVLLIIAAPYIVEEVLGPRWQGTVPMIQLLAAASLLGLFREALVPLLKGHGALGKLTSLELAQSIAVLPLAWILAHLYGLIGVGYAFLVATALAQVLGVIFVEQILEKPFHGTLRLLVAIGATTAAAGALSMAIMGAVGGLFGLGLALFLFAGFYLAAVLALDHWLHLGIVSRLRLVLSPLSSRTPAPAALPRNAPEE
jgi:O-antigen/teichoic acid export membrane protein